MRINLHVFLLCHRLSRLLRCTKINQYQTTITAPPNNIGWFDIAMNTWLYLMVQEI
jgi:hypothetical protein